MSTVDSPKFNISQPFNGTIVIVVNQAFADLLGDFIEDVQGGVEKPIWAFKNGLRKPGARVLTRRSESDHGGHDDDYDEYETRVS